VWQTPKHGKKLMDKCKKKPTDVQQSIVATRCISGHVLSHLLWTNRHARELMKMCVGKKQGDAQIIPPGDT